MKVVTLELKNDNDLELLVALTKRLDGEIINIEQRKDKTPPGPVHWLNELAGKGGIKNIKNPSEWQKDQRKDKELTGR